MKSNPFAPYPAPKIIGHRGAAGLVCENTIASFEKSASLGIKWVETDLRLSKDGEVFIFHDDSFARFSAELGSIESRNSREILEIRLHHNEMSYTIPSLDEVLDVIYDQHLAINLELKPFDKNQQALVLAIQKICDRRIGRMPLLYFSSFDEECLHYLKEIVPQFLRGYLTEVPPSDWVKRAEYLGAWCLGIAHDQNSDDMIRGYVSESIPILAYTVNDPKRAKKLFDIGVSGIFTDRPDLMKDLSA